MLAPLQPEQLESCAGWYRVSRLVHLAARLDLATALRGTRLSAPELAARLDTQPEATVVFVEAWCACGLLERDSAGRLGLTAVSARLLPDAPNPAPTALIAGWAGHDAAFEAWAHAEHCLRTGEGGLCQTGHSFESKLAGDPGATQRYQQAMSTTTAGFEACAAALDGLSFERVVDLGGGRGELLEAVLRRHPRAQGWCLELPHVVQGLMPRLDGRLQFLAADALQGIPLAADLYLTSTLLRCLDDTRALRLLRHLAAVMRGTAARLVCFELTCPAEPDPLQALQAVTALVVYGGRERRLQDFEALFDQAGLTILSAGPVRGQLYAIHARERRTSG